MKSQYLYKIIVEVDEWVLCLFLVKINSLCKLTANPNRIYCHFTYFMVYFHSLERDNISSSLYDMIKIAARSYVICWN